MRYISAGESLKASDLNTLTSEADRACRCMFGGHSWIVYGYDGSDFPEGKRFYFGDNSEWKILSSGTLYDHTTYETAAAGLTVVATDTDLELAWCEELTWTLDDSLEAHRRTEDTPKGPRLLYLANRDATTKILSHRERHRKIDVAEIVIEGWDHSETFEFDAKWNKYHFVRFHNLDSEWLVVKQPNGQRFRVRPFGVQAARRAYPAGDTWDLSFRYFWPAESGDLLILAWSHPNNVANPLVFHDVFDAFDASTLSTTSGVAAGFGFDLTRGWSFDDGTYSAITAERKLYELTYYLGDVLAINQPASSGIKSVSTPPSWSRFIGPKGWNGIRFGFDTTFAAVKTTGATRDIVGLGSNVAPKVPVTVDSVTPYYPAVNFDTQIVLKGVRAVDTQIEGVYYTEEPGPVFTPNYVTANYNAGTESNPGWRTKGTLYLYDTVRQLADIEAVNADEATEKPSITFRTDSWNLFSHATVSIPAALGFVPSSTELTTCSLSGNSIAFPQAIEHRAKYLSGNYQLTTARQGRKLSDYVGYYDLSENVTHQGHPDVTGEDGLAGGIDFEHDRGTPVDSAVSRLEYIDTNTATKTLPVIPLDDSCDRILENIDSRGWYATNRTDLKAGTLSIEDKTKVVRVPIVREHYNHVAQRVNQLVAIRPLQFRDALWWGQIADGTEGAWDNTTHSPGVQPLPSDQNYPTGYYCAVLSSGARCTDVGGLPTNSVTVASVTKRYLSAAIVANRAQQLGFRFFVDRLETPRRDTGAPQWWPDTDFDESWRDYRTDGYLLCDFVTFTSYGLVPPNAYPTGTDVAPVFRWEQIIRDPSEAVSGWELSNDSRLLTVPRPIVQYSTDPLTDNPTSYPGFLVPVEVVAAEVDVARYWTREDIGDGDVTAASISALHDRTMTDSRAAYDCRLVSRIVYQRT